MAINIRLTQKDKITIGDIKKAIMRYQISKGDDDLGNISGFFKSKFLIPFVKEVESLSDEELKKYQINGI